MKYSQECFGSRVDIHILSDSNLDSVIAESFGFLNNFEQNYSRFIPGNILGELNLKKSLQVPREIISLIELCIKVSKISEGYFDITLLPVLENNGYGVSPDIMHESIGYNNIEIQDTTLVLHNNISLEFGSFGKGYALDLLYNSLIKHSDNFVINFGGDIRVAGNHTIHLEDPLDTSKNIGTISLQDTSIASSGGNKRKINVGHHLLNPKTKTSDEDILAVYVTHTLGVFADIFATALFVSPPRIQEKILQSIPGLEALILHSNGKIHKTQNFNCQLTL